MTGLHRVGRASTAGSLHVQFVGERAGRDAVAEKKTLHPKHLALPLDMKAGASGVLGSSGGGKAGCGHRRPLGRGREKRKPNRAEPESVCCEREAHLTRDKLEERFEVVWTNSQPPVLANEHSDPIASHLHVDRRPAPLLNERVLIPDLLDPVASC